MSSNIQPGQATAHHGWESSSSSASSSAGSSPRPPLPDAVLRSFQFPSQRSVDAGVGNVVEAHTRSAGNSVPQSVNADDHRANTATTNNGTHAQERLGIKLSTLSNHDLDLIIANLEVRASERRAKIRRIEALSQELGLDISQHDWAALLNKPASDVSSRIAPSQSFLNQCEIQERTGTPQSISSMPLSGTQSTTVSHHGSANRSPDIRAEPETPLRSLRPLRGLKRARFQVEPASADGADHPEDEEAEERDKHPVLPVHIQQPLHASFVENGSRRLRDPSLVSFDALARRTAWSVVLETYPEEIAKRFRAGERPANRQICSMVGFSTSF